MSPHDEAKPSTPSSSRPKRSAARATNRAASATYEVGYGKPPVHTRWKMGQSGNPKGRGKKPPPRSLVTAVNEALWERVTVPVNGVPTRMPKMDLIFIQLINKAAKGDLPATRLFIQLFAMSERWKEGFNSITIDDLERMIEEMEAAIAARRMRAPKASDTLH